jgi:hypothetical protein
MLALRTRPVVEPSFHSITVNQDNAGILIVDNLHAFCLTDRA